MPGMIVVFEGLPGCGKSSIAREVAKKIQNCVVMPEVSELAAAKGFEVADRASIGTETWFLTQYYTRGTGEEAQGGGQDRHRGQELREQPRIRLRQLRRQQQSEHIHALPQLHREQGGGHARSIRYNAGDWRTVRYGDDLKERGMIEDCDSDNHMGGQQRRDGGEPRAAEEAGETDFRVRVLNKGRQGEVRRTRPHENL